MRNGMLAILGGVLVACGFLMTRVPAQADGTPLTICNRIPPADPSDVSTLIVAVGYATSGANDTATMHTGPDASQGWATINSGQCLNIPNPFSDRYMYWYAEVLLMGVQSPLFSDGDYHFCVPGGASDAFTFEDENASESACINGAQYGSAQNKWVPAREVDLEVSATVDVTR